MALYVAAAPLPTFFDGFAFFIGTKRKKRREEREVYEAAARLRLY
jgi:hypothetical protein